MSYDIDNVFAGNLLDIGNGAYDVRLIEAHGGYIFLLLEGDDALHLVKIHPGTEVEYDRAERVYLLAAEDIIRERRNA